MNKYPTYKPSNIPWLGEVPEHWEVIKIKWLFDERIEKGFPNEPLLAATQNMGVVLKEVYGQRTVEAIKDLHLLKLVKVNDFVISLRSFQGGIEISYYQGIISPAYTIMIPKGISVQYFKHLAKSKPFIELLQQCVTGIREGQNIDYNILKNSHIPIPPDTEQTQIVHYLDEKLEKIDKVTDAKRKQIELLKEQKQVMINEELKIKNEELKEKLTIKFKKVFRLEYGKSLSDTQRSINGKYPVYGANGIIDRTDYYYIDKPSLIIGRKGSAGAIQKCVEYFWPLDVTYYTVFDENKYDIDYLFYLLLTLNLPDLSKGIKPGLNRNDVYEIEVVIPSLAEQQKIVAYLDNITAKIDLSIAKIEREILLLGEYRTRLISDVVTGKVDIRNLAIQENKADSQLAKTIKLTPKHSKGYDDAVILTALVNSFGTDEHPFTAFDCQKFPYLLHRHIEGIAEKYGKFAAGPYNPILKYRTARPIALKKKYIREHTGGYKGFVADVNAQEAVKYFMEWYGDEPLEWMERFRYIPNRKNELELLTTVDMAMVELTEAKKTVALQEVKEIIKTSPAWKDKLTRPIFSDENIMRAINWSYKLFGNPKDVKNKD